MMPHVCTAWCHLKGEGVHCIPAMIDPAYNIDLARVDFGEYGMDVVELKPEEDVTPHLCDVLATHYTDSSKRGTPTDTSNPNCVLGYVVFIKDKECLNDG